MKIKLKAKSKTASKIIKRKEEAKKQEEKKKEKRIEHKEIKMLKAVSEPVKKALIKEISVFENKIMEDIVSKFEKELKNLQENGKMYKCEYAEFTISEITKRGFKSISNDGWIFCFCIEHKEGNNKYVFQRPKTLKGKN